MRFRTVAALLVVGSLPACASGSGSTPAVPITAGAPQLASAVREPAALLASGRRSPQDLTAAAAPLSAVAWPLSAVAWPLTAVAWPGAPAATTNAACPPGPKGASCKSLINVAMPFVAAPNPPATQIAGIQPSLLRYIYNLPSKGGNNQTVAVVVANDDPQAEADLGVYRSEFGLPPCTTANGCFQKIPGSGSALPPADPNWSVETSLDLDAVSAVCSSCDLMLVEAASNQIPDLAAAVDTAAAAGATEISNSYGVSEASDNVQYASHYNHPGIPITASAGDISYGVQFPASVPTVTAVGGTSVQQIGANGLQEVVWPLTGSGCSAFFPKPAWQHDGGCATRTVNDVAMLADPNDGISVYDSTLPGTPTGGWSVVGGTSLAAPLVAAIYALAASNKGVVGSNAMIYAAAATQTSKNVQLLDVTAGSNGTCAVGYLCNGGVGYNGPTGNGVPWGVDAFDASP